MSDTISSGASVAPLTAPPSSMALLAASMRNALPRVVMGAGVAAVAALYIGPGWALAWAVAVCAQLVVSARLMGALGKDRDGSRSRMQRMALALNSLMGAVLQATVVIALWRQGDDLCKAFAIATGFVGSFYILLLYYQNLPIFRLLVAPFGMAAIYISYDRLLAAGMTPAAFVTVIATALTVINFFYLARRQMDRSRLAVRRALTRAEQGELSAEAANAAKSTFLATMSHEIRTPLNGVLGMAQAMAGDALSEKQRDRLSVIHRSGEALLAILNDVLDLSKIEAGKLELESIEFDLAEVARGTYSAFTALANKKGLSFALDIGGARGRYLGDPTRLRQILYNLISNALKFTEQGEIRVTAVRVGGVLEISVADTGVGIPPEGLPKLFAKFDQLDSSTTRRFGGTGLGLAICRELVQLMGGEISVDSELGRGSRFRVTLPLPWVGEAKPASVAVEASPKLSPMALRVLAAEDNAVNQLVLKTLLHQMGVDPTVVDNGASAVEAWEAQPWDMILMDIQMPGMDGLTATTLIREREKATGRERTPIVALTANAMSHQVEQYIAAGMDGHVAKPIEAAALLEVLSSAGPPEADESVAEVA